MSSSPAQCGRLYRLLLGVESLRPGVHAGHVRPRGVHAPHGVRRARHLRQVLHALQPSGLPAAQTQLPPPIGGARPGAAQEMPASALPATPLPSRLPGPLL